MQPNLIAAFVALFAVFVPVERLFAVQAIFVHANVRFRLGPLRWLFSTPEFHHWHHAAEPQAINKNYAGRLPLLDLLFGTLHMPRGRRPGAYGIGDPVPSGYLRQMAHPFRRRPDAEPSAAGVAATELSRGAA